MPPDTPTPGSPEDWLRHARSDLALAQQRSAPEILLTTLCFHTQQAAEKGIKAVLVQQGLVFPYTHDLARLITLVKDARLPWPEELDAAADLTESAVGSRYPGPGGGISETEYQQASRLPNASWPGPRTPYTNPHRREMRVAKWHDLTYMGGHYIVPEAGRTLPRL
jgi:HEPN domain-containing protein